MGLETHSIVEIKERFHKIGKDAPSMWWEQGNLWIDCPTEADLQVIEDTMIQEVLAGGFMVQFDQYLSDKWKMQVVPTFPL